MILIVRNFDFLIFVYFKVFCDVIYSVLEDKFCVVIYILEIFIYGNKMLVIFLFGIGMMGYVSFVGNFIFLLLKLDWVDFVWVNVFGKLFEDV